MRKWTKYKLNIKKYIKSQVRKYRYINVLNLIKLLFYSLLIILVMILTHKHTSTNITPYKPKAMSNKHIREPTNDYKLIMMIKQNYVFNVTKPKKKQIHHREINVIATAYIPLCKEGCTGVTATGMDVKNNTTYHGMKVIATDPSVIPLHSIVKVKTKNTSFKAIALDTGGGINGFEVDVLMSTKEKAINFGREYVTITILREGEG